MRGEEIPRLDDSDGSVLFDDELVALTADRIAWPAADINAEDDETGLL